MFPLKLVKAVEKVIYVYFKTNTEHINRLCGQKGTWPHTRTFNSQ